MVKYEQTVLDMQRAEEAANESVLKEVLDNLKISEKRFKQTEKFYKEDPSKGPIVISIMNQAAMVDSMQLSRTACIENYGKWYQL